MRELKITSSDQFRGSGNTVSDFGGEAQTSLSWDNGLGETGGMTVTVQQFQAANELMIQLRFDSSHPDWFSTVGDTYTTLSGTLFLNFPDTNGDLVESNQAEVGSIFGNSAIPEGLIFVTGSPGPQFEELPFFVEFPTASDNNAVTLSLATYDFIGSGSSITPNKVISPVAFFDDGTTGTVSIYDMVFNAASGFFWTDLQGSREVLL